MSWQDRPGTGRDDVDDVAEGRYADGGDFDRARFERAPGPGPGVARRPVDRARERPAKGPITATRVTIVVALVGSVVYLAYAVTVRDTNQIPLLASGAAVLGLVFVALAIAGGVATYRAGNDARFGRAVLMAVGGGIAGIIAAGAFAFALVLALAYRA